MGYALRDPGERPAMWLTGLTWATVVAAISAADVQIAVGPNVHVGKSLEKVIHNEVVIAADPADPARMMAGAIMIRKGGGVVAYRSSDGGKTWALAFETSSAGDPAVAYGPDGIVYYSALYRKSNGPYSHAEVRRSVNGGQTWEPRVRINGDW